MTDLPVRTRDGITLHSRSDGQAGQPALVFANALGTTLHVWDAVLPLLPAGLHVVRYDMRGHGGSDVPEGPYTMGQLVSDAEAVCDAHDLKDAIFVGLSVGGMVAQGLAVKRPDLIRALVLSNTAAKIGNPKLWSDRIAEIRNGGMAAVAAAVIARWFGRDFRDTSEVAQWHAMVAATPAEGYCGVCAAIAGTDFYTPTSGLRIPTLAIAGAEDGSTPADLVRETADLIPGSQFALIRRAGHVPCADQPEAYAALLRRFIADTGHLPTTPDQA